MINYRYLTSLDELIGKTIVLIDDGSDNSLGLRLTDEQGNTYATVIYAETDDAFYLEPSGVCMDDHRKLNLELITRGEYEAIREQRAILTEQQQREYRRKAYERLKAEFEDEN